MIEYIPNVVHIPCDCERCVKIEAVIESLKKRIIPMMLGILDEYIQLKTMEITKLATPSNQEFYSNEIKKILDFKEELQKILGEEKPQRMVSTKEGREELAKYDITADSW